jgi:lipopolysaccharide transport system permease protein
MPSTTIEPGKIEIQYWRDIWRYRELLFCLTWRDILVRYKQTVIGIGWALIRPLLIMLILTLIFGRIANFSKSDIPYPIIVFCGLLPWHFFASAFAECGNSLISNSGMISKIYFPRLVIPISSILTSIIDFIISCFLMIIIILYYQYIPSSKIVFLPIFIIQAFLCAFGAGLWISALMVRYRDFKYIVPFMVQFGLYVSPVGFTSSLINPEWRFLYSLNPIVGVIDGFRWSIIPNETLYTPSIVLSFIGILFLLISGILYFRSVERTIADVI